MNRWLFLLLAGGAMAIVVSCAPIVPLRGKEPARRPQGSPEELARYLREVRKPAILFVGNSYTQGVPLAFQKYARSRRQRVRIGHSAYGGWTLARHAAYEPTLRMIREGKWDVVVLQEHSLIPAIPRERERDMIPAVKRLAAAARAAGATPVLYQTWGRLHGDSHHPQEFPDDTFLAMHRRLQTGYRQAADAAGGLQILPAGDAWAEEFRAGRAEVLFLSDGSHPSPEGNALTAKTMFEALFGGEQKSARL